MLYIIQFLEKNILYYDILQYVLITYEFVDHQDRGSYIIDE
jgi:hypothetical protein